MIAYGQTPEKKDYSIRVGVEEVRIDATVLDSQRRQVSDLTAADFEVYQDGKPQKIVSCTYITDSNTPAAGISSAPLLTREQVRRTLAFVVDDLSMTFEQVHFTQTALRKFVETQMLPGDMVAILQASHGVGAQQLFSSDKQLLLSKINNIRWSLEWIGNDDISALGFRLDSKFPENKILDASVNPLTQPSSSLQPGPKLSPDAERAMNEFIIRTKIMPRINATFELLNYCLRALQDMPGRKALVLMSPDLRRFNVISAQTAKFSDAALRAGIVIFALDMTGLEVTGFHYPIDDFIPAKLTGGIMVQNSNFFFNGVKPVQEALKGYYLLSYIPPENTFAKNDRTGLYHRIRVKVKRRGVEVRSRDGFFGEADSSDIKPSNSLQKAVFSPFLYNDLSVSLLSGYAYAPKPGYYIKSWLHLDGKDLTFNEEKDGSHSLSLELAILTTNFDGIVQDSNNSRRVFIIKNDDLPRIKKDGIDCDTFLTLKNPGDYYIRAAIKDISSGKIGSGYQFLKIPDLKKSRLALSSVFVLNRGEDSSAIQSNYLEKKNNSPVAQMRPLSKSPALRSYFPGEGFDYIAVAYNTKTGKEQAPKLEFQSTIIKDGQVFYQGDPEEIESAAMEELGGIPIMKKLIFKDTMGEGEYSLILKVTDKQANKKSNIAVQAIDFQIRKGQ
jgi:VWFA-related protein